MVSNLKRKGNSKILTQNLMFQALGIFFIILAIILLFSDIKLHRQKKMLDAQISEYKSQIKQIEKSSQKLKDQIANTGNKDYLEKIAYEQLGQARPGEIIYSFVMPKTQAKSQPEKNGIESWLVSAISWIKSKF